MSEYDAQQLDMLEPAYLARFDLTQPPFSPALDERFFYLDAERAHLLDLLQQLIGSNEALLLINGERGAGKTSLLQYFVRHADQSWRVCQVDAHALMDTDQLLWRISQGFGIGEPSRDPSVLQGMLYEHMAALHRGGVVPILIVDNAHELPVGALEAIFHLADAETAEGGRLLLTILFCEPQIETLLDAPTLSPLRGNIGHTLEMPRLSAEQTAEYLQHRLNAAGRLGEPLFSLKDIRRIQKAADGVPGRVNEQAHQWLNKRIGRTSASASPAKLHLVRERWFLIVGLGIVAIAAILVFHRHFRPRPLPAPPNSVQMTPAAAGGTERQLPLTVPPTRSTSTPPPRLGAVPPAIQPGSRVAAAPPDDSAQANVSPTPQSVAQTGPATGSPASKNAEPPVSPHGTTTTASIGAGADSAHLPAASSNAPHSSTDALSLRGASPDPVPASRSPQTIVLSGHGFTPETQVSVTSASGSKYLNDAQVSVESDSRLVLHVPTGAQADTWTVTVSNPGAGQKASTSLRIVAAMARTVPVKPQPTGVPNTATGTLHTNAWLLARNPAHFTLQLLSTRTPTAIATFVRQHGLGGDLARFDTAIKGVRWYTLVDGDYADRAGAEAAARQLPANLSATKPWIRSFGDIQGAVRAGQPPASAPAATLPPPDIPSTGQGPSSSHDVSWLWSQDPGAYTLQLLATHTQANVAAFIEAHHLHGKAVYFHARHAGQDWYTLIYGVYPDRAHAVAAIKQLPPGLRNASPWARSYASVQAELSPTASPTHR